MSEPSPAGTLPAADPLEDVVAHFGALAKSLPSGVPDWAAAELTFGQLRLLSRLFQEGPTSMSGIGDWLGIGLPSVTGMIERLERHGLVGRRHRTDDRRIVEAALTDRGRELVADIRGIRRERLRRLLGYLEPGELSELGCLFRLILDRAGEAPS